MIILLFFWLKRRTELKAAEEAKILSAKQQRPASDAAAPLINNAGLGHAPQELDHPKGLDWIGRAELPLNVRTAQAESMGSTALQELSGDDMLFSQASVWREVVVVSSHLKVFAKLRHLRMTSLLALF